MLNLAADNLKIGKHPILDGNFTKEIINGNFKRNFLPFFEKTPGHSAKVILCTSEEKTLKARILSRALKRDREKTLSAESWSDFFSQQTAIEIELEGVDHFKIETTTDSKQVLEKALSFIL